MGIVDLTDGEPTPKSPGPEARLAEAQAAAAALGAAVRVTLDLPNRRLFDTFEARVFPTFNELRLKEVSNGPVQRILQLPSPPDVVIGTARARLDQRS